MLENKDTESTTVIEEEIIQDPPKQTLEEKLEMYNSRIKEIDEYVEFIKSIKDKKVGDEFDLKGVVNVVVKRTKGGHITFDQYNVFEEDGITKRTFKSRITQTQKQLDDGIMYAINMKTNIEAAIDKLSGLRKTEVDSKSDIPKIEV